MEEKNEHWRIWRELFELAEKSRALEPWEHYADGELFAVELPDTQETLYFGFIGMYGHLLRNLCYPGDEGLKGHFRTCEAVHNPLSGGGGVGPCSTHDALMCLFQRPQSCVRVAEKSHQRSGPQISGQQQWANFTSYRAQMFPDEIPIPAKCES